VSAADLAGSPPAWRESWRTGGVTSVLLNPQVLGVFVRSELRDKYRGTWLGGVWSYARPLTRFFVYFIVIGVLFNFSKRYPNFPVYIFCGIVVVQYFATALVSGTRSLAKHQGMLRRVNIPSENIPIASVVASFVRQRQSMIILVIATALTGWRPVRLSGIPYAIGGAVILTVFVSGLVLIFSVANMYVKDTQYAVETIVMMARWASPVIYPWTLVPDRFGPVITTIYLSNPVTVAMFGLRAAFWEPTVDKKVWTHALPPLPLLPLTLSVVISIVTFAVGVWVMHRAEHRVASRIQWNS